jgi:hypothetical protein
MDYILNIIINFTPNLTALISYFIPFELDQCLNNSYISVPSNSIRIKLVGVLNVQRCKIYCQIKC